MLVILFTEQVLLILLSPTPPHLSESLSFNELLRYSYYDNIIGH